MVDPDGPMMGLFVVDFVIGAAVKDMQSKVSVSSYLSNMDFGKTGWSLAVNQDGSVMGVSWQESLVVLEDPISKTPLKDPRSKRLEELVGGGTQKNVLKGQLGSSDQLAKSARGNFEIEDHWVSVFDVADGNGLSWTVIVAIPVSDFMSEIRKAQVTNLLIVAGLFVAVVLLGLLITKFAIVRPLGVFEADMGHLAEMDFASLSKTSTSGISEIKRMQRSFNGLRDALNAFFKYVPVQIVKTLSSKGSLAVLGMYPAFATISFTDIKGFTTMCTRVTGDVLASIISAYFEIQTCIVQAYRGVVDKFIGDCLMVLWGAPLLLKSPNLRATCAALAMDRATKLAHMIKLFSQASATLVIRTGIHAGNCLAGNMGTTTRMNYTVIGDTVNTAARLEAVNKDFGTRILISHDVASAPEDGMENLVLRQLTNVRVVGREEPLPVYEVMGLRGSAKDQVRAQPVVQVNGAPLSPRSALLAHLTSDAKTILSSMPDLSDIKTAEILPRSRAMCRIVSAAEEQWAAEFSAAVERYVSKRFDEALPLLQAALGKAPAADAELLNEMIRDCQGPRVGVIEGKHK